MESQSLHSDLKQNLSFDQNLAFDQDLPFDQDLSFDKDWLRAIAEVEHILGSDEPLVTAPDETDARPKRRRSLVRPLGVSLFLLSWVAVALALIPTSQPDRDHRPAGQSAVRQ